MTADTNQQPARPARLLPTQLADFERFNADPVSPAEEIILKLCAEIRACWTEREEWAATAKDAARCETPDCPNSVSERERGEDLARAKARADKAEAQLLAPETEPRKLWERYLRLEAECERLQTALALAESRDNDYAEVALRNQRLREALGLANEWLEAASGRQHFVPCPHINWAEQSYQGQEPDCSCGLKLAVTQARQALGKEGV